MDAQLNNFVTSQISICLATKNTEEHSKGCQGVPYRTGAPKICLFSALTEIEPLKLVSLLSGGALEKWSL